MAYATVDEVEYYFQKQDFGASDPISSTQVQFMLDSWEALLNRRLSAIYTVPITDADDLKIVKEIQCKYVAADIDDILKNIGKFSVDSKIRDLRKEADAKLDKILKREILLSSTNKTTVSYRKLNDDGEAIVPSIKMEDNY